MTALCCPTCGRLNDAHDRKPGEAPHNGDVSLCWSCHSPAIFVDVDGSLALRQTTPAERAAIELDPEFQRALAAIGAAVTPEQAVGVLWGSS